MIHFKDNKNKSALSTRWAQMSKQEQIIEKKKIEIQTKMEAQKQAAALAAQAKLANVGSIKEDTSGNIFSNDGSFMSQYKSLLEKQRKDKQEQEAIEKQKALEEDIKKAMKKESKEKKTEKTEDEFYKETLEQYENYHEVKPPKTERPSRERQRRWNDRGRHRGNSPVTPVMEDRKPFHDNQIPPLMQQNIRPPDDESCNANDGSHWDMSRDSNDGNEDNSQSNQGPMHPGMGHGPMGPGPNMGPGPQMGPGPMPPNMQGGPNISPMLPGPPGPPMPPFMGGPPNFPMPPNFMGPNGPMPPNMSGPPGLMPPNMPGPNGPMPSFFGPNGPMPPFPPNMGPNSNMPFMGPPRPPFGPNGPNFGNGPNGPNFGNGPNGPNFGNGPNGPNFGNGPNGPNFGNGPNGPNFGNGPRPNFGNGNGPPMPPFMPPGPPNSISPSDQPPLPPMPNQNMDSRNMPSPNSSKVLSTDNLPPAVVRAATEVARNGQHWENVLKAVQDQNLWFLFNTNSNEYKAYRDLIEQIRMGEFETKPVIKPEDKYEPEFSLEDDESNEYNSHKDEYKDSHGYKRDATSSQSDEESEAKRERRKRKKSRWGDDPPVDIKPPGIVMPGGFNQAGIGPLPPPPPLPGMKLAKIDEEGLKLTNVNRNNPALMQYAMTNYGTTNLNPDDWKKCEDNFKLNLLYQDMLKKRQELERLAQAGRNKYEYDSDEDTAEGTWEHKLRLKEMSATEKWATELTKQAEGKHHIGDFLPPEELKKFMEKYSAVKLGKEPDLSDYKEYKLKEDNLGFKMLQKLGWSEGQGLGAEGTGIVDPINKANQPVANLGLGAASADGVSPDDDEFDAYRKRMMLAYRFRPNPLNNPRRPYY